MDGQAIANSPIERSECNETTGSDNSEWVSYSSRSHLESHSKHRIP